jgi:hypothetical protein
LSLHRRQPRRPLWPLADHQGTIRDVVSEHPTTGNTILRKHTEYETFGQVIDETYYEKDGVPIANPTTHAEAIDQLHTYTGRELDFEAGLTRLRLRMMWESLSPSRHSFNRIATGGEAGTRLLPHSQVPIMPAVGKYFQRIAIPASLAQPCGLNRRLLPPGCCRQISRLRS